MTTGPRFGWRLPMWPADDTPAPDLLAQIDDHLTRLAGLYDSVWLSDHFVPGVNWRGPEAPTLESLSALAYYAGAYQSYDFGTIVLANSYRSPALLAKMSATIQALTRGRFILGIGAGWKEDEYLAYGYPFPAASARLEQLEEAVQLIRAMWAAAPATWEGKHYQVRDAYCNPLPDPPPPILIGGGGERKTLRIVARHADWWNLPAGTLADYARKLDILRAHCAEIGRDPGEITLTWETAGLALADSETEARRLAETSPFYQAGSSPVGTPEQVADQLRQYMDLRVSLFIIRFADFPDPTGALRFAEEVMPLLRA